MLRLACRTPGDGSAAGAASRRSAVPDHRSERFQGWDSCAILCAMAGWPSVLMTPEFDDLTDDVRRLFRELDSEGGGRSAAVAGQCAPALDVLETDEAIEIVVDLPGVPRGALRVLLKGDVVVVAGEKIPISPGGAGDYHLVERGIGALCPCGAGRVGLRRGQVGCQPRERRAARRAAEDPRPPGSGPHAHDRHRGPDPRLLTRRGARLPRMNILFIGDIVGRPGRDLMRAGLDAIVSRLRRRFRDRQRRERRGRLRHHARNRRRPARARRRRDDVGQSHLGQEGSDRLHRRRGAAVAAGQLPGRRAGTRQLRRPDGGRPRRRRDQRDGPRFHADHRRPLHRRRPRGRERTAADADHLRGFPRRGDLGEDRDGVAPRRAR